MVLDLYTLSAEIPSETQHFRVKVPKIWGYEVGFHFVLAVCEGVLGLVCLEYGYWISQYRSTQPTALPIADNYSCHFNEGAQSFGFRLCEYDGSCDCILHRHADRFEERDFIV